MKTIEIDKEIKRLENLKKNIAIKDRVNKSTFDTLYFTYLPNYKKVVHFSNYEFHTCGNDYYEIICSDNSKEDGENGHVIEPYEALTDNNIFMKWNEILENLCPICRKYYSLKKVLINQAIVLREKGDKIVSDALNKKHNLYEQADKLENEAKQGTTVTATVRKK